MIAGGSISATQVYKPQNVIAWIFMTLGPGLMSLVMYDSPKKVWVSLPIPFSIGIGLLFAATVFPGSFEDYYFLIDNHVALHESFLHQFSLLFRPSWPDELLLSLSLFDLSETSWESLSVRRTFFRPLLPEVICTDAMD